MFDELHAAIAAARAVGLVVPRPPRLPTDEELDALSELLGRPLQADLREYLRIGSDVTFDAMEPVTIDSGHTAFAVVLEHARAVGVPDHLVPFCEDNGDFFCIDDAGRVEFWSHNGVTDETWTDLATWIRDVWIGEA